MPDNSQYGFVASLASAVPELAALLAQATAEQWDPGRFESALQDTAWWKTQWPTVKSVVTMKATDPAQYDQKLSQAMFSVQQIATELGILQQGLDWKPIAEQALALGWNEAQIRQRVGQFFAPSSTPDIASGQAGQFEMKLKQLNQQYGAGVDQNGINWQISQLISGRQTLATYENFYKKTAKAKYPGLWQELDSGMTVAEVASPYRTAMAQILELPETQITLDDPWIQKALQFRDDKGQATAKPLWQHQMDVKKDARWDQTQNAQNSMSEMLQTIGAGFGFSA